MSTTTPPVPVDQLKTADELFSGLGGFWTRIYSDTDLVRDYCKGSGELAAQVYLEFLEATAMLGLPGFPVFKRERIVPVVLRKSQRDMVSGGNLYLGRPDINLGPQDNPDYHPGTVFHLGGSAMPINTVGYPISSVKAAGQLGYLCNTLLSPTKVLARNVDYRIDGGDLMINSAKDPFEDLASYPHRTVYDSATGAEDVELVLWLTDVLHDKEWLRHSYGYISEFQQASSDAYRSQLEALWALRTAGSDVARVRVSLAGLLGIAAVQSDNETVSAISACSDGSIMVATDKQVYRVGPDETMLAGITIGATLQRGDYLTETVRLYSSLDTRRFYASNGYPLSQFLLDVPRLYIPKGMIGVPSLRAGFALGWEEVDLVYEGETVGGNPKLKFSIAMDPADQSAYWSAVWTACDRSGVDLIEALNEYVTNPSPTVPGTVVGRINPLKFYMDNFLGVNLSIVVVDFGAISAYSTSLEQLGGLENLLPAHTMVLIVLLKTLDDEEYDLATAKDQLTKSVGKRLAVEEVDAATDSLQIRWVRQCS